MKEIKAFNIRLPKDLWLRLKHHSANMSTSSNKIIIEQLEKILPINSSKSTKKVLNNKKK